MRYVLGALALLFGVFFAGCEVKGTWEFLLTDQGAVNYIVLAGAGIAAALSLLPAWAALAWRGRWVLSVALWVMFGACLLTVISAAIGRTGTSTDLAQGDREKAGDSRKLAADAEVEAKADVTKAETALAAARRDVVTQAALKTCADNCARLLSDAVKSAENDVREARLRLDAARSDIVAAPPPKSDSLSKRIAGLVPFVTEEKVRLYQPIAVPALTSILSAILTALGIWALFGGHAPRQQPQKPEPASDAKPEPLAVSTVAPLAQAPQAPQEVEVIEPERLQIAGPRGPVHAFASSQLAFDTDDDLHIRDARIAYERFCRSTKREPIDLPTFVREMASIAENTGNRYRVDAKDVYLVGARLVTNARR